MNDNRESRMRDDHEKRRNEWSKWKTMVQVLMKVTAGKVVQSLLFTTEKWPQMWPVQKPTIKKDKEWWAIQRHSLVWNRYHDWLLLSITFHNLLLHTFMKTPLLHFITSSHFHENTIAALHHFKSLSWKYHCCTSSHVKDWTRKNIEESSMPWWHRCRWLGGFVLQTRCHSRDWRDINDRNGHTMATNQ